MYKKKSALKLYHRFLDESGDTTFYGKNKRIIVGSEGVSKSFILGMVKFKTKLDPIRKRIIEMQNEVGNDTFYADVPSIQKKKSKGGYYFHAKDDLPEVREKFFRFLKELNCSFEAIVARKIPDLYENKHEGKETLFYADVLSHLIKNKFMKYEKFVLNIAGRGKSTKNHNLLRSLDIAQARFQEQNPEKDIQTKIVFNVCDQTSEPLLNVADYFCWCIQNVFEKGNVRYYNFLNEKISSVVDLYDFNSYEKYDEDGKKCWPNYYGKNNLLSAKNKLSPPTH
jgi:hypothetical protein